MNNDQDYRIDALLDVPRDKAFSLFLDHLDAWWVSPFSSATEELVDAGIEPRIGGNCYEIDGHGRRRIWGTVLSLEAPLYVRLAWQVSQDGQEIVDPQAASRVMVNFREAGEATRFEVVHSEFLRHGEDGADYMSKMASADGWPRILTQLKNAARKAR